MIYLLDWFLQAAYKVGGYTVSADTIQNTILRCRMSRPGQVNSMILTTKKKDKNISEIKSYRLATDM
jgi:hypothetical protein